MTADRPRLAVAVAVASALVVVVGVLAFDWPVFTVMALYWAENVLVGIGNLLRMGVAGVRSGHLFPSLFVAMFFSLHYGLFTVAHGVLLAAMFGADESTILEPDEHPFLMLGALVSLFGDDRWLLLALAVIAAGVLVDALRWAAATRDSDEGRRPAALMGAPYGRVAVLHLTLLLGAALVQWLKAPLLAVLLLVALKLAFDLSRNPPWRAAARAG
jgi:hypothetical protein